MVSKWKNVELLKQRQVSTLTVDFLSCEFVLQYQDLFLLKIKAKSRNSGKFHKTIKLRNNKTLPDYIFKSKQTISGILLYFVSICETSPDILCCFSLALTHSPKSCCTNSSFYLRYVLAEWCSLVCTTAIMFQW